MAENTAPQAVDEKDKPFADWLGKILAGKAEVESAVKKQFAAVHGKHTELVEQARKAEATFMQLKEQIVRAQGAADSLLQLLRGEFEAEDKGGAQQPAATPEA